MLKKKALMLQRITKTWKEHGKPNEAMDSRHSFTDKVLNCDKYNTS